MRDIRGFAAALAKNENGATSIEYAALAFGIGLALLTALPLLKSGVQANMETIAAAMNGMGDVTGDTMRHDPRDIARQKARAIAARSRPADAIMTSSVSAPATDGQGRPVLRRSLNDEPDYRIAVKQ